MSELGGPYGAAGKGLVMTTNLVDLIKGYLTPGYRQEGVDLRRRVRVSDTKGGERHRAGLACGYGKSDFDDGRG